MEFYEKLTSLLKSARKVQKLDLLKKIEEGKKEETFKKFKDNLIPFLEFKVASEEAKNFRKYWVIYNDDSKKNDIIVDEFVIPGNNSTQEISGNIINNNNNNIQKNENKKEDDVDVVIIDSFKFLFWSE